jgi:hypothetical protein
MSFIDSITDVGGAAWEGLTGPSIASGIARAGILALMLREVQNSINDENESTDSSQSDRADYGVREQIDPNTESSIPVVYGSAFLGGNITDAVLTDDNKTMWYCITLCEKTGVKIDQTPSEIRFEEIYWNNNRVNLQADGVTAATFQDEDGVTSDSINGLIKFYFYRNGSSNPIGLNGVASSNSLPAYQLFPNWTTNHAMSELAFVIVRVDYNASKSVTGLGKMQFKVNNNMSLTGDVLFDYMTNSRYGGGIELEEIYAI